MRFVFDGEHPAALSAVDAGLIQTFDNRTQRSHSGFQAARVLYRGGGALAMAMVLTVCVTAPGPQAGSRGTFDDGLKVRFCVTLGEPDP